MYKSHINRALYVKNQESDEIAAAVQPELDAMFAEALLAFRNAKPSTAEADGIALWETILGIIPSPATENMEFRRARLIIRLSNSLPYTERRLHIFMDAIMGSESWDYLLDTNDYWLYIMSMRPGRLWLNEMQHILETIMPANMRWSLHLFIYTWRGLFEDWDTWEDVFNNYETWEHVYYGEERGQ